MSPKTIDRGLILASTSSYRRALLARLQLPFSVCAPEFDEVAPGNLPAAELVRHNTLGKARSLISRHPLAAVIASDQVAVCGMPCLESRGTTMPPVGSCAFCPAGTWISSLGWR
jgi:Nucleotide-binding protein implicated in inhibition of septum formation